MKIRCLIVDDEPLAREILKNYIQKISKLELVDSCKNAMEAFASLSKNSIDIIFLDINMPEIDGISFIKLLKNPPIIVLTTAHDRHALESYSFNVVDYLLKPFSLNRFLQAIQKIESLQLYHHSQKNTGTNSSTKPNFFFVKSGRMIVKITLEEIKYIEAQSDYVSFHLVDNQQVISYGSLKNLDELLPKTNFLRVHRSYIVAIDKIDSILDNKINMGTKQIPIGAVYKDILHQIIKKNQLLN